MPKLPQVSARDLAALLTSLGYRRERRPGGHAQFRLDTAGGSYRVTVPAHGVIAVGTLAAILRRVATHTGNAYDDLVERLR